MVLRGSYADVSRRVDEIERRAQRVAVAGGCATCRDWPADAVLIPPEHQDWHAPWYCRGWSREGGEACSGCVECSPTSGWPTALECPDCHRRPQLVIRITYEAWNWRTGQAQLPDAPDLYERLAGEDGGG